MRAGRWETWGPTRLLGRDLYNSTLGIIGLGRIGAAVARRSKGFNMRVLYYSSARRKEYEQNLGIEYAELDRLSRESDFITIHTSLSPKTYHLITMKHFEQMKRSCILVNTSRGSVVDNVALYDALRTDKILYAGLDVTEPEPIPADHPLLTLDNVIFAPHIASASVAARRKMGLIAADNLIAGLRGQHGPALVNPQAWVSLPNPRDNLFR